MLPLRTSLLSMVRLASCVLGTDSSLLLLRSRLVSLVRFFKDDSDISVREHEERFSFLRNGKKFNFWFLKFVRLLWDKSKDVIFGHLLTASAGTSISWNQELRMPSSEIGFYKIFLQHSNNSSHRIGVKHQNLQVGVSQENMRVELRDLVLSQIKTDQAYQMFQHSGSEQSNTEILWFTTTKTSPYELQFICS